MSESDSVFDALQRHVDELHTGVDRASLPPAGLWKSIRLKVQPDVGNEERQTMINPSAYAPVSVEIQHKREGFWHYGNLAATLVLVLTLALGSWFSVMQLNRSDGPEPRLALLSSTPDAEATPVSDSTTCDVEPLSTDTVMDIVRNPARFMAQGPTGEPAERPMVGSPPEAELWEVDADLELVGETSEPTQEHFDEASIVVNEYLGCLVNGTQAQIWTYYSPVLLQQKILGEFPVFAEESQVRSRVEELATQPAYQAELVWQLEMNRDISSLSVNPERKLALAQQSESSYYVYVINIGVSIIDSEGKQISLTNGTGRDIIPNDPLITGRNPTVVMVVVAHLRSSDTWVIIPWPSDAEIGW